jgi:hypothetical protein
VDVHLRHLWELDMCFLHVILNRLKFAYYSTVPTSKRHKICLPPHTSVLFSCLDHSTVYTDCSCFRVWLAALLCMQTKPSQCRILHAQYHRALQSNCIEQHGQTGILWATSSMKQLVTRPTQLFDHMSLVTTSLYIFFTAQDLK